MQPNLKFIEQLARGAGEILSAGYQREHKVKYKGVIDLVTEVDHQSEAYLIGEIQKQFDGHHILAEESGETIGDKGHVWYIDPLDGTVNYAHHIPIFCVSIAYASRGTVKLAAVYDPLRGEMFSAERGKGAHLNGKPLSAWNTPNDNFNNFVKFAKMTQGVRRLGSAALDCCYVGAGRFDGFWELTLKPWDIAAAGLIAEEAGARVTNVRGGPDYISSPQSIVASAPGIHQQILDVLK
ncbi:MAG: inositol monophosphatase [Chloroflexi bacterium]|nr:inositol monophosphatase [Chloroflexota bacterium]